MENINKITYKNETNLGTHFKTEQVRKYDTTLELYCDLSNDTLKIEKFLVIYK